MRTFFFVVLCVLSSACPAQEAAQDTVVPPEKVSMFMRAKLLHSQKLLEALTVEDFKQMGKHSQELSLLSQSTIWNVLQTPEYIQQSTEFRRRADALTDAAAKKNLDSAAITYVELTLKCVQCHKYVRDVRRADNSKQLESVSPKK